MTLQLRRGFKAEANRIALRVRAQLGLVPVDPIDPFRVCEHFEIQVFRMSELNCDTSAFAGIQQSNFSAVTAPRGMSIAIVHNDAHRPYRQRSNICHELAHCFVGHKMVAPVTEDGGRHLDREMETEAEFLSGSLLMPSEAALHVLTSGLLPVAQFWYGVSKPMLDYRLRVSGAITIFQRSTARQLESA